MGSMGDGDSHWPPQHKMGPERDMKVTAGKETSLDTGTQVPLVMSICIVFEVRRGKEVREIHACA